MEELIPFSLDKERVDHHFGQVVVSKEENVVVMTESLKNLLVVENFSFVDCLSRDG